MRRKKKKQDDDEKPTGKALPPIAFLDWWNPTAIDETSGASIGGHPDAERVWARKDPGRWSRRTYGINAMLAWDCASYRDEYHSWKDIGCPAREPFVSICATLERVAEFAKGLKATLAQVGKPMPKPQPRDWDRGKAPRVEPIDEAKALPEAGVVDAEFIKLDDDEEIKF
jgi:hypothetical protein